MNAKKPQKFEPGSRSHLAEVIEAANRTIKDYLFRQHCRSGNLDGGSLVVLPFPCRRTNAGEWINADLEAPIDIRPTKWRPWQKAKARKPQFSTGRDFPHHNGRRWSDK